MTLFNQVLDCQYMLLMVLTYLCVWFISFTDGAYVKMLIFAYYKIFNFRWTRYYTSQ